MSDKNRIEIIKNFFFKYWEVFFFLAGFFFDIFTLGEIDDTANIISQSIYLALAGLILIFEFTSINPDSIRNSKIKRTFIKYYDPIFHFITGSLLSVFTLFYFKSTSLITSFIFISLISFFLIANELPGFIKLGKIFKSFLLGICSVSFFTFLSPIVMNEIGRTPFFIGICFSLFFLFLLFNFYKRKSDVNVFKYFLIPSFSSVLLFLILYIFKILPPVPLAIKDIGVYQKIEKLNGVYHCYHQKPWYNFWDKGDQTFYLNNNSKVHVFFAIYSPTNFSDSVIVRWSKKEKSKWIKYDDIPIKIVGGRKKGFRGIAYKKNISPGKWKVSIRSKDLREIGRINVNIIDEGRIPHEIILSKDIF